MKTYTMFIALVLLSVATLSGAQANPKQSGMNGDCVDYNATYDFEGVYSPAAAVIVVDGASGFIATKSGGAVMWIDWYNAADTWIGYTGASSGVTPSTAVKGTICIGLLASYPDVPDPTATWTYQDGL